MNIKGGALEFDIIANNGQINSALEETKKRVKGFTDATVEGGDKMEAAYKKAAETIEAAWKDIDTMTDTHKGAIADLEKEYARLGEAAGQAFQKGTAQGDEEYRSLTQKQQAVQAEINQRKQLLQEIGTTADALLQEEQTLNSNREKVEQNTKAKGMLRTQVMQLKNALAEAEQAGKRDTDEYRAMQAELGRLTDAMGDANTQAKIMADDYRNLNTAVEVISGVTGAFSAAQGAVGLFAGENENLQKIMVKVQSLMAITIGLQQVSKTLNKDSYTQLVLVRRAKELLTVAETKFATALGISNVMAKALMATLTLGLSVAITAIVVVLDRFITKNREAKKAQEEFNKKVSEAAVKPISAINELSYAWGKLGNNLEAKKKFVEENAEKFKELGVQVNNVYEAENLLIDNKEAFIQAQVAKAKALAATNMAAEVAQEALENQLKLEEAKKTPKVTRYMPGDPMTGIGSYTYEIDNPEIAKYDKKGKELDAKITKFYELATASETENSAKLKAAGIHAAQEYADGTVGAYEAAITKKQAELKNITDNTEYNKKLKEIETLQKQIDKITGGAKKVSSGGSSTSKGSDPFLAQLEERKKKYTEYYKWVNSKDDIVRNAAKTEFAGLLKEGSNYLDYLKKQREQLTQKIGDGSATKAQTAELHKLNNAIAEETKDTVLAEFEKELQNQLNGAHSILEMLTILEEKRKALAGDGSDLDNGKKDILDKQQEETATKAKDQTRDLLDKYANYLGEKITFEANYAENSRLLNEQLAKAKTDDERRIALEAISNLEKDKEKYSKQSGNSDYDALTEQYKTYQQKCADISEDYDTKIALAKEKNNAELVTKLEQEKNKALSSAALEELQSSGAWTQLFGNLDDLTTDQIQKLIAKIEGQKAQLGVELSPEDLDAVLSKLREAKNEVETRNPFKALQSALKDYKKDASKANLSEVFKSVAGSVDLVKGSFDAVIGGMNKMGINMDEETQAILGDIGGILDGASQLSQGIASGNPLSIIQGSIGLVSSVFSVFNSRDRKAEKAIKKHGEAVKDLQNAYKALEHAVDKALGETVYDNQKALIANMREQQVHLRAMWQAEESKKKTDGNKVREYKEQYEELGRTIEDTIAEIAQSITQTSAKDLANELADAIAETFTDGFNSKQVNQAIEKVVKQVMQNAVKNALKLQFLETPLQAAIQQLQKDMGFDSEGNGSFDGLSAEEQARFKARVQAIAANYTEAMKMYEDLFKDLSDDGDPSSSLSGAIKGASQESIDLLAGQTNAVRVNQVEGIDILRQQLVHLASIDGKIGASNLLLSQIYDELKGTASDPLRAQGITI